MSAALLSFVQRQRKAAERFSLAVMMKDVVPPVVDLSVTVHFQTASSYHSDDE